MDIVSLIEDNPITRLSGTYQSKLLEKVKVAFTDDEQQMFVTSYYCYLNFHTTNDFVIDLDNIWKWLGFSQKVNAKRVLDKNFILDKDYKCMLLQNEEQKTEGRGGHNKETIMLNIKTFKLFCMKAGTKKADQTHEYYVKLEELLHEVVQEETVELRLQLENHKKIANNEKELIREKTILEQFPNNVQCVYYGKIDNTNDKNESLIKFGNSNFLRDRVESHKRTFTGFRLVNAFKVCNKTHIENAIKNHPSLQIHRRSIMIQDVKQTELLVLGDMSQERLDKIIEELIRNIEYSPENYTKLLEENAILKQQIMTLQSIYKIPKTNSTIKNPDPNNTPLDPQSSKTTGILVVNEHNPPDQDVQVLENINSFLPITRKHVRKYQKQLDGKYHINEHIYEKLYGTRQEVWDNKAYMTGGLLSKDEFIVNKHGKIVSKNKQITSLQEKRLKNRHEKNKIISSNSISP